MAVSSPTAAAERTGARLDRRIVVPWCLYDWASSALPAVVLSFVFASYFTGAVAPNEALGTALWGNMISLSGVAIAVLSVTLGPIADLGGRRKPWLALFTAISILCGLLLWFIEPRPDMVLAALALCFMLNVSFELATVFYNATLPDVAPREMVGRVSGWGWGIGYIGAIVCLALALILVQTQPAPFGLDRAALEHVRITSPLAALWFLVFALPFFVMVPDRPSTGVTLGRAVLDGVREVGRTIRVLKQYPQAARFLIAHVFYRDGINTLFIFGGIYAAGTFSMTAEDILLFGVMLYIAGGIGAVGFAWIDDWIGGKRTVLLSLAAMVLLGVPILLVESGETFFWLGVAMGAFFGPAQSASRSLMARLAPAGLEGQMFGLFALSGKVISPFGPLLVGWLTLASESQRVGMSVIVGFFVLGGVLLLRVREPA